MRLYALPNHWGVLKGNLGSAADVNASKGLAGSQTLVDCIVDPTPLVEGRHDDIEEAAEEQYNGRGQSLSLAIYPISQLDPAAITGLTYVADVLWGAGGVQKSVTVDCNLGVILNLTANYVRASVRGSQGAGAPQTWRFGAHIGRGDSPRTRKATTTVAATNVAAGGGVSGWTKIPSFARRASWFDSLDSNSVLQFATDNAGADIIGGSTYPGAAPRQTVEVPGGANYFQVVNNGAAIANFRTVFELDL